MSTDKSEATTGSDQIFEYEEDKMDSMREKQPWKNEYVVLSIYSFFLSLIFYIFHMPSFISLLLSVVVTIAFPLSRISLTPVPLLPSTVLSQF